MANDCLVINLESEIDDENLPVLGALDFDVFFVGTPVDAISSFQIATAGAGCEIEILDNGNFYTDFSGTVTGKTATKIGAYSANRIFLKPEVFTRNMKLRIKNAFTNLVSFGNPNADWSPGNAVFVNTASTQASGWRILLPKEIQFCSNLAGMGLGCVPNDFDLIDFTKLTLLRTMFLQGGVYYANNQRLALRVPAILERLNLGGNSLNIPVGIRGVDFDIFTCKAFVSLEINNTNVSVTYTGDGSKLSTKTIGYYYQATAFVPSNTAQFDLYLQALSLCTFGASGAIRTAGTRTSASDTAVATLVSKLPGRFQINGVVQL